MPRKLLCAVLVLQASVAWLSAADAFTGTWKLDLAKSTFASDNPPPRELTLTFTERADQVRDRRGDRGVI